MKTKNLQTVRSRIIYLGIIAAILLLLSYLVWGLIGSHALSQSTMAAADLTISKNEIIANGQDFSIVSFTIIDSQDETKLSDVWVGLNIVNPIQTTDDLSYFGWYSPEPNRAFYQTDQNGQIKFNVRSKISGDIIYAIYAANPDHKNSGKYQNLNKEFTLHFQ